MPAPRSALPTSVRAQKCGMVMSVTTQIIFPYMSDARTPAMDVQMAAQDACMTRSFHVFLSAMLIEDDGYGGHELPSLNYEAELQKSASPKVIVKEHGLPQAGVFGLCYPCYPCYLCYPCYPCYPC